LYIRPICSIQEIGLCFTKTEGALNEKKILAILLMVHPVCPRYFLLAEQPFYGNHPVSYRLARVVARTSPVGGALLAKYLPGNPKIIIRTWRWRRRHHEQLLCSESAGQSDHHAGLNLPAWQLRSRRSLH
jgi:hypothetical protein